MKKLLTFVLTLALVVGISGCSEIELDNISFNLGSHDEPEKTSEPVRCQLILDVQVVTVMGAYVYPAMVNFDYVIEDAQRNLLGGHATIEKYTNSQGFVRYTTDVITLPANCYVKITCLAGAGITASSMSYTYSEIKQETNRGMGTDLYILAKSLTVVKGSSGVAP